MSKILRDSYMVQREKLKLLINTFPVTNISLDKMSIKLFFTFPNSRLKVTE